MKIVHFRDPFLPKIGGAEIYVDTLGKYLVKKGHQATVLTTTSGHVDSPYEIVRLNSPLKVLLWLTKNSYDIVNVHNFSIWFPFAHRTFYPLYTIRKLKKIPVVFTVHGSKEFYQERKMWDKVCYDMANSDFTIFISHFMTKYAKELNGENYAYVPNPVDTDLFQPQERDKELLDLLDISSKFAVLIVSRLSPERNVELILEAAKMLKGEEDIVFLVAGGGAYEKYLKTLAQKWECKNVIFVGEVSHTSIPRFMSIADVFLNPINIPEIGRSVIEAMACGKCVFRRVMENDDPNLKNWKNFIEYEDIYDLVAKIVCLKSDKELTEKIGKEARKVILNNYSIEIVGNKIEKIYDELVNRRRRR